MKKRSEALEAVVARTGLLAQMASWGSVVVVDAPRGYGKSTLLRQYAATQRDGGTSVVLIADDTDFVDIHGLIDQLKSAPPESVVVLIDEASRWPDLVDVAISHRDRVRQLVVADRSLSSDVEIVLDEFEQLRLVDTKLRFSPVETMRLVEQRGFQQAEDIGVIVGPACDAWPEALTFYLDLVARSDDPMTRATQLAYPGPHTDELIRRQFAGLDGEFVEAMAILPHLDGFTSGCIDAVTGGTDGARTARKAGLSLVRTDPDFYRLPHPIGEALRARTRPDALDSKLLSPIVFASTNLRQALRTAVRAAWYPEVAAMLELIEQYKLDELPPEDLISHVRTVRRHIDSPRLAMIEFRAHRNRGAIGPSIECLESCLAMADDADPDDERVQMVLLEARIESLYARAFGEADAARREIRELRRSINGSMTPAHRLRLEEIESFLLGQAEDPAQVSAACDALHDVATSWLNQGEKGRAASTWRRLAATALSHLGRYDEAIEVLRKAQKLTWNRLIERTLVVELTCRMKVLAGNFEGIDALFKEAWSTANATELPWVKAYLHWSSMWLHARRGDGVAAVAALERTRVALGPLLGHETGVVFRSEAAIAMAEVGDIERAVKQLEEAAEVEAEADVEYAFAQAVVFARQGNVRRVDSIVHAFHASGKLPPLRAWRLDLEQAIARRVEGGHADVAERRERALLMAEDAGQRSLAEMVAEAAWAHVPVESEDPSDTDDVVAQDDTTSIRLLGDFEVHRGNELIPIPQGHVAALLKMLAVSDTPVAVEVVLEALWPDTDPATGRRRIKNVLGRLRTHIGVESINRANDSLSLGRDVEVDLRSFEQMVRAAFSPDLQHDVDEQIRLMRGALDIYQGPVLPADLYEDWIGSRRDAAQARAIAVLDRVSAFEPELRPSATWLLDVVLRIDAADDQRLLEIARKALLEGHEAVANEALEQAMAAAEDLGIKIDDEIDALRMLL